MNQSKIKPPSSGEMEIYSIYREESNTGLRLPMEVGRKSFTEHAKQESPSSECSKRYLCTAACALIGVISAIILLVVVPAFIINGGVKDSKTMKDLKLISLKDVLDDKYSPRLFNGTWESDTEFSYISDVNLVMLHDMETMTSTNLILNDSLIPAKKYTYELSYDHKYLLLGYNATKRFRHKISSHYTIIDLEAQTSTPLVNKKGLKDSHVIQLAFWAPNDNALVYVHLNNIYYRPSAAQNETEHQITDTGVQGKIYNGVADWIYDDAIFGTNQALWFSNDGLYLAYASFNDSLVLFETVTYYGDPTSKESQYSLFCDLKYPKPGTHNPNVTLSVVDIVELLKGVTRVKKIPPPLNVSDAVLSSVAWINNDEAIATWKNRIQNELWVVVCNISAPLETPCIEEWSIKENDGWIGVFGSPRFSDDSNRALLITSHEQVGDEGRYPHLTMMIRNQTELGSVALTAGIFTVFDILGWDETQHLIVFTSTVEYDPARVHVFQVSDDHISAPHIAQCLTCGLKTIDGDIECRYSTAYFSNKYSYYMHHCWGPDIPEITLFNKNHELVSMWDDNRFLRDRVADKVLPRTLRLQVPVPGGLKAQVQMWLPPMMDSTSKYPLVVDVYAGPDSYQISDRYEIDWRTYLVTNMSYIYVVIDGRGTSRKGDRMLYAGYRNFGTVEIEDQLNVTNYLLEEYPFLDRKRTAIWGWSYGGYSTLKVLENDSNNIFKCGIAVAPVTDWTYYTSMYTERFMGLPTVEDNLEGYKKANVNDKLDNLSQKKLFLIHGTFDNIALYHNTMMFTKAMHKKQILFKQQTYPDEDHALTGVLKHLYTSMGQFLQECFD